MGERTRLIVFAKPPVAGRAKTRLSPALTPEQAAAVYEASLRDVMVMALSTHTDVEIHSATDGDGYFAREFPEIRTLWQAVGDLGQRMAAAFDMAFAAGDDLVLLIGSDSPTLPAAELTTAADAARADRVVLGPALDGGYYLVGIHAASWPRARAIFHAIPWSTRDGIWRSFYDGRSSRSCLPKG